MKCYEENTAAKYVTKLPSTIDLNGDWEVALSEIMYPTKMEYNVKGIDCLIRVYMYGDYMTTLYLPEDEYEDPETLMADFIDTKENYCKITYDENTKAIEMKLNPPPALRLVFSDMLARLLGFKQTTFEQGRVYIGELSTGVYPSMMFVYCDLIEHVTVGDVRAPLLRTFDMVKTSNDIVHRHHFTNLVYVPVQKKQFDSIEINIMRDTGEPMPFDAGKSLVLLHFRRSSNPYFLLQR